MIDSEPSPIRVVLYEGAGAIEFAPGERAGVMRALLDKGTKAH